jgi:hypothetical protein
MAHCPFEKLADLLPVLAEIRLWEGIREKSPGVFYFKSIPFLHFHEKDGRRWADVRAGRSWGAPIDVPFKSTAAARRAFTSEVRKRYALMP